MKPWIEGRMEGWMDGWIHGRKKQEGKKDAYMHERSERQTDAQLDGCNGYICNKCQAVNDNYIKYLL